MRRPSQLLRNRGDGSFVNASSDANISLPKFGSAAVFVDIDSDGDEDLFVSTLGDTRCYLFVNDGHGRFTEEAEERGVALQLGRKLYGMTPAVGDVDGDGFMELFVTEYVLFDQTGNTPSASRLFRNLGPAKPGYFTDVTNAAGVNRDHMMHKPTEEVMTIFGPSVQDFGAGFVDMDGDGKQELVVIGDSYMLQIYWNNGDFTFTPCQGGGAGAEPGQSYFGQCGYMPTEGPMGITFADLDYDGRMDMFVTSSGPRAVLSQHRTDVQDGDAVFNSHGNRLYFNHGDRSFGCKGASCRDHLENYSPDTQHLTEDGSVASAQYWGVHSGGWGWGAVFFDYDNDADEDLLMTNGFSAYGDTWYDEWTHWPKFLWRNDGGMGTGTPPTNRTVSKNVALNSGIATTGQGRGVLVVDYDNNGFMDTMLFNQYGDHHVYRNHGGNNNGWLRVYALHIVAGKPTDSYGARVLLRCAPIPYQQLRQIGAASHFMGQSERVAHFGLGEKCSSASVTVSWPSWGNATLTITGIPPNHIIKAVRPTTRGAEISSNWADLNKCASVEIATVATQDPVIVSRNGATVAVSPTKHMATYFFRGSTLDNINDSFDVTVNVGNNTLSKFNITIQSAGHRLDKPRSSTRMELPTSGLTAADYNIKQNRPFGELSKKRAPRMCNENGYTDGVRVPAGACFPKRCSFNKGEARGGQTHFLKFASNQELCEAMVLEMVPDANVAIWDTTNGNCNAGTGVSGRNVVGGYVMCFLNRGSKYKDAASCPFVQHFSHRTAGSARPSARQVSNTIHAESTSEGIPDARGLNDLHMHWGQFISHDLSIQTQRVNHT